MDHSFVSNPFTGWLIGPEDQVSKDLPALCTVGPRHSPDTKGGVLGHVATSSPCEEATVLGCVSKHIGVERR